MADLEIDNLYGYRFDFINKDAISLQLHLTAKCDQQCKHCYMFQEDNYINQLNNPMDWNTLVELINESYSLSKKHNSLISYYITGGDPILSPYFWNLLEYIKNNCQYSQVIIMGNSYHLDEVVIKRMKENKVVQYQISLDGLEQTHDKIRKEGSYRDSIRALKLLHKYGIKATVMFTLSNQNINELIPLYRELDKLPFVDQFSFDRVVPIGNAKDNYNESISSDDYKRLLYDLLLEQINFQHRLNIGMKDNLWKLLLYELGWVMPFYKKKNKIVNGCTAGRNSLSILADGTILACRRLNYEVGTYKIDSLSNILMNKDIQEKLMDISKLEKCKDCEIASYCRGCCAQKKAQFNSFYAKDPCCWRNENV